MSEPVGNEVSSEAPTGDRTQSWGRRTFLKGVIGAGAAVSLVGKVARAEGELGYWGKDLSNEKLTEMFTNIVRIRWHERTMADKMLTDPKYRGYNHFYAGQEAVAVGVCSALRNKGAFDRGRPGLQHAPADRPRHRQGRRHEEDGRGERLPRHRHQQGLRRRDAPLRQVVRLHRRRRHDRARPP